MGTQTLLIDEHHCIRCGNCIAACEGVHDDGQARLSLTGIKFYNLLAPNSCWQCENPLCMLDCPPDAHRPRPARRGLHQEQLHRLRQLRAQLPLRQHLHGPQGAEPSLFGWVKSLFGGDEDESNRTVAVKCDLCRGITGGPACVRSCPTGAAIRVTPEEYQQTVERLIAGGGGH